MSINLTPRDSAPGKHPTLQYRPSFIVHRGYRAAETFLTLPQRVEGFLKRRQFSEGAAQQSFLKKTYNNLLRGVGHFGKLITDFDFRASHYLEFPGKLSKLGKYLISEPPMGTLVVIMMLFNIPSRMKRAVERDPTGREMWDVMRRDVTGISILLFALGPLVTHLSRLMQKFSGIRLVDETSGLLGKSFQRFSYRQFSRNYTLSNAKTLEALVRDEGNHEGILRAAQKLSDGGLAKKNYGTQLKTWIEDLKKALPPLFEAVKNKQEGQITALSEQAYQLIHQMDGLRQQAATSTAKGANAHIADLAKALPKFSEFISRYAMTRRLMVDVFSLLLCVVGIGWFPVWFNDFWNRKRHTERLAHLQQHEAQRQQAHPAAIYKQPIALQPIQMAPQQRLLPPAIPPAYSFSIPPQGIPPGFQYNGGSPWNIAANRSHQTL